MGTSRVIPAAPQGWTPPRPPAGHSYEIELITPLFGGGVEAQVNDTTFPIRPTSIRGQLQFWWRATVGARYATSSELRRAQTAIWGNTQQASRVRVLVESVRASDPVPCAQYEYERDRDGSRFRAMPTWGNLFQGTTLPYALFPFQGQLAPERRQVQKEPACYIAQASFRLTLIADASIDFSREVEPALWAWVHFGGLGSRTRRGCGAIRCPALAPRDPSDLAAAWRRYVPQLASGTPWPTLAAAILVGQRQTEVFKAWDAAISLLQKFRQGVGLGRNPGQQANRPGRSRWPEAETIRRVTGRRSPQHARLDHIPDDAFPAFPRAELGLPIVFHFKDQGEPPDTVLYPGPDARGEARDRMASPLILKPLALKQGGFLPLIVHLQTPALDEVDLRQVKRQGKESLTLPERVHLRDPKLAEYRDSPLSGRSPQGSALEAFLAYAQSQGFTRVTR